jgi:hypothetical protein
MPFGKFRGQPLGSVPSDYIVWCLGNLGRLSWPLRTALEDDLARRRRPEPPKPPEPPPPPPPRVPVADLQELVGRWYRHLTLKWHPDRGGSEAGMQAVNDAQDLLGRMLQELL